MPVIGFQTADGQNVAPKVLQEGGPVERYDVEINGVLTTLQLTEADAKARGLIKQESKQEPKEEPKTPAKAPAKAPANKAKTPANKANG